MSAEARTLFKIKSIKQKTPMKLPHSGEIAKKVSQVSQTHAVVKEAAPSRPHLPQIMPVRRISIQSYRDSLTAGVSISKVKLIKLTTIKVKEGLPKFQQPTRIKPKGYKHLPKIKPQKAGLKLEAKTLHKVFIQQSEPVRTSSLPKMILSKAPLSKVELTPLPKVEGQSMPSPSLPQSRTMLSLKKLRELEEFQPITEEAQGGSTGVGVSIDFFDLFLDCVRGEGGAKGAFDSAGPAILVLTKREDDDYARAIQIICRETYLQRTNLGKPDTPVIAKDHWEDLEHLDPKHNVSLIEWDKSHSLPANFLEEFARAEKPGFLIFYVDQLESEEFYDMIWDQTYPQKIRLYLLSLKKLSLEIEKQIASLAWGLGEGTDWINDISDFRVKPNSFDDLFLNGEAKFRRHLEQLKSVQDGLYRLATKPSEGGESELHYGLKMFLVRYYAKKRNLKDLEEIEREVQTEYDLNGGKVDLYLEAEKTAIEVETLYGRGFSPLSAIDEKVRSHVQGNSQAVHFILSNLTFLRCLNDLKGIKRNLGERSPLAEFYTVDIKRGELLPLSEVEAKMRYMLESML